MKFILEFLTGTNKEKAARRDGEKLRSVQKGNPVALRAPSVTLLHTVINKVMHLNINTNWS
ncbi:MAG: hypothetical protein AYP45_06170 [Candidatus Brocadia carolinensis]|uniref:Uncharacterized protein n=1 Tax=Candidatus Brocadia carolinensis TaxID=1004156 RepID=A0A1V4AV15_9BACT|nr:MAG: hypothetical protein AYP45_06170 [Candidatus Brocadia caroliniensis]